MTEIRLINLRKLVSEYESQKEFADAIDMAPAYINHLLTEHRPIGEKTARKIEARRNLPRGWMDILRNGNIQNNDSQQHNLDVCDISLSTYQLIRGEVPLISFAQSGNWREAIDNGRVSSGERMIQTTVPIGKHTFALTVTGDSMESEFVEGEIIVVEPDLEAEHEDYVIARVDGSQTFKQLIKDGCDWYLKPLNDRYPIKPLGDGEIIGVVREKTKTYK